jgi:hypothetical protein
MSLRAACSSQCPEFRPTHASLLMAWGGFLLTTAFPEKVKSRMARMRQFGSVEIPQEAFIKALKMKLFSVTPSSEGVGQSPLRMKKRHPEFGL